MRSRYSKWDDSQDPLGDEVDVDQVLAEMSEDLLSGYGGRWSLRELHRRGMQGRSGLDAMLGRLRRARREWAERSNLSGPLQEIRAELDEILGLERASLGNETSEEAQLKRMQLDALPRHPAGALRELQSYDFSSGEAKGRYAALMDRLRREVLDSYFKSLMGSMGSVTAEDVARIKDMMAELNEMIAAHNRGDEVDFEGFMTRYGDMFPENPRDLDELLEILARRMAAMSRLMASLTSQQRAELQALAESVLGDLDLAWEMDQLNQNLRELMPSLPWDEVTPNLGDQEMPMSEAVDAIERVSEMEELEQTMSGDYAGATLEDIDEEQVRRALDEEAVGDLQWLKKIERALEEAGIVNRTKGRLELTARGARMIGERSLTQVLDRIRREPSHRARGGQSEPTGQTKPWTFGDTDPISVERTVYNAVLRSGPARVVKLAPEDFEVVETESRPRTATALLLDLSFSMPLRGHWVPAKRMALALHALIVGKYPQDSLYLIGFSDYARRMDATELASAGWEDVHGTNMEHAFMLANRVLAKDPRSIKQVIMVTDGEPTAHLDDGYALFNWPPIPETIEKTLRQAMQLARSNISINVFMLESSPGLEEFMGRLSSLAGGQIFRADSAEVGQSVIGSYLRERRRRAS
ncbi:MAG: vWA domain-containing protein [Actinomycetota bacterium]